MSSNSKPKIGFIGLGLMGAAIVKRLQDLEYPLTVIANRNRTPIEQAVSRGAFEAKTASELASRSDIILLCVDTTNAVESIMNGEEGVLGALKPGSIVIDFGTSIPGSTRTLAKACSERGASMMDAPLGRTPKQALEGLLNIMAAGAEDDFKRVEPVLKDIGENIYHVGPIGAGHTLKLINNFFGMTMGCAMSEAFAMADLAGLDREVLYDVMSSGPLHSSMMDFIKASAVDDKKDAMEFTIVNGHKDVDYYNQMAQGFNVQSNIAPSVIGAFENAIDREEGHRFVPEMVDIISAEFTKAQADS